MIVLGVDPSSTSAGWGLIALEGRKMSYIECGCIRPKAGTPMPQRLLLLCQRLGEIIAEYRPDEAAIESTFFGKDPRAAAKLKPGARRFVGGLGPGRTGSRRIRPG